MVITFRVKDIDGILIKRYAKYNKETVTNMIKRLVLGQIEKDFIRLTKELEVVRD